MAAHRKDLSHPDQFSSRHLGPTTADQALMLEALGLQDLDTLIDGTVPASIRLKNGLDLPPAVSEHEALAEMATIAEKNQVLRSFIGLGYHDTITPPVILRNIFENPGWYTQYTPYQAEISQGRLEALLSYQTAVCDLTGLPVANSSLLDEATAAAEAMAMMSRLCKQKSRTTVLIAEDCHPQTIEVVKMRAEPLGITVTVGPAAELSLDEQAFGMLLQYPASDGGVHDYRALIEKAHDAGIRVAMACDLLSLALLTPPGELGADVAFGNSQRFGVPLGFGGPHAAFFAAKQEHVRQIPGRIIGVSVDSKGEPALRMALQTREQHIRREKATSNICTAQVLLAIMAGAYAVYHGPKGIAAIAEKVHLATRVLAEGLKRLGFKLRHEDYFDTLCVESSGPSAEELMKATVAAGFNIRRHDDTTVGIALDEKVSSEELEALLAVFAGKAEAPTLDSLLEAVSATCSSPLKRESSFLEGEVFNTHHSETQMLRYLKQLESRDLSLTASMIPLGSCTMKLNATAEMLPVTWAGFGGLHPFAPVDQTEGYAELLSRLSAQLGEITGLPHVSLQPNSGASGEFTGLLCIRAYHLDRGDTHRNICLIPSSAHGTNPASAAMAGMKVVVVRCDEDGNVDLEDLVLKAEKHADNLAALMVTYPSTHGVFEEAITEVCATVTKNGGLVYLDGANLNAQVGLCRPGDVGAAVCHLNLHKTFAIPHGGGGPGMGPICVSDLLAPYLPGHPIIPTGGEKAIGPVSAAPYGSASILPISHGYIRMLGLEGVTEATRVAILAANYLAKRLGEVYPVLYTGSQGYVAHECILDLRPIEKETGISAEDVAKRLMDYSFHAPTMSFPVPGTLMIEPTESEPLEELDRFCTAMLAIRAEIQEIADGTADKDDNVLKNAPHPAERVMASEWSHPYSRETAAFPVESLRKNKFWPPVGRVDNAHGDRNLCCTFIVADED